jgi:hypothetical protein
VGHVCVKKKRTSHADPSWTTDDQIVIKRKTRELGIVPKFCLDCVEFIQLSLSKLS